MLSSPIPPPLLSTTCFYSSSAYYCHIEQMSEGRLSKKSETTELLIAGYLKKRSPKSLLGVPLWQKRFFQLHCNRKTHHFKLLYYKSEGGKLLGSIPLHLVEKIQLNNKKEGSKFEIIVYGGKIFSLEAGGDADGQRWFTALSKALDEEKEYASPLDLRPTPIRAGAGDGGNNSGGVVPSDNSNVKKYWKASGDTKQKSTLDEILATVEPIDDGGGAGNTREDSEFLWESEGSDDEGNNDNEENQAAINKRRSNDHNADESSPREAAPSNNAERKSGGAGRARFVSYMVDDVADDDDDDDDDNDNSQSDQGNKQRLRKSDDRGNNTNRESNNNNNNKNNPGKSTQSVSHKENSKSASSVGRISVSSESDDEPNQNTAPTLPLTGTKLPISDHQPLEALDKISPRAVVQSLDEVPASWIDTDEPPKKAPIDIKDSEKSLTSAVTTRNYPTPKLSPRDSVSRPIKSANEKTAIQVTDSSANTPIPPIISSPLQTIVSPVLLSNPSNTSEPSVSRMNQKIISPQPSSAMLHPTEKSEKKGKCCEGCLVM